MKCAIHLKEMAVYLQSGLVLYSILDFSGKAGEERERLKQDILLALSVCNQIELDKCLPQFSQFSTNLGPDTMSMLEKYKPVEDFYHRCVLSFDRLTSVIKSNVYFSSPTLNLGDTVSVHLRLTSIFQGTLRFDEMVVCFTKDVIVHKINHMSTVSEVNRAASESDEGNISEEVPEEVSKSSLDQNLTFKHLQDLKFDIQIPITDEVVQKVGGDILAVERLIFIQHQNGVGTDGSIREVVFEVDTSPRSHLNASTDLAKVLSLGELVDANSAWCREYAIVNIPEASVTLKSPSSIEILQGIIQRVDFTFHCNEHTVHNGKIFLSYDPPPDLNNCLFFWYPNVFDSTFLESVQDIQKISFSPIRLSDQQQPMYPLEFLNISADSDFTVSVFVRLETLCSMKFKLRLEYNPSNESRVVVGKEFEITCQSIRPVSVSFNIMSAREASCGVSPEYMHSSVLRGDNITLSSSITCTKQPKDGREIAVLDVALNQSEESAAVFQHVDSSSVDCDKSNFLIRSAKVAPSDRLQPISLLNLSEYLSLNAELICLSEHGDALPQKLLLPSPPITASVGAVSITWCLNDPYLFFPSSVSPEEISNVTSVEQFLKLANVNPFCIPSGNTVGPLDQSASILGSCCISFTVPPVQVFDAPFDIRVTSPSVVSVGKHFKYLF